MNTLTQTLSPQQLTKETITVGDATIEVDLHLTDWDAFYSGKTLVTMLADLHSTELDVTVDEEYAIAVWSGLVACTVAEPTEAAVTEMIRSHGLTAENYNIGHVWKPELEDEF